MKTRFRVEIKSLSDQGAFDGLLSVYNVVDDGQDVVEPGAFTKTIQDRGGQIPLLWQHKADAPIGSLTLSDTAKALEVKGQLLMELPLAQQAYALMKAGIVKGLSIGYEVIKKSMDGSVRRLKELKLYEGSLVTFPMNELAVVTAIKAKLQQKDDFNEELAEIQLQDAGYQMRCALSYALSSILWDDTLDRAAKITASEATIQQFSDAYMAYLPDYIDLLAQMYGGMEMMSRKAGRTISAATRDKIMAAHEQMQAASETLLALVSDEAGSTTSEGKAAAKTEPAPDHSAIATQITELKGLLKWNRPSNSN